MTTKKQRAEFGYAVFDFFGIPAMPCVRAILNLLIAGGYPVSTSVLAQAYHIRTKPLDPIFWVLAQNCLRHHAHGRMY
jgi:hypothetical protein